MLIRARSASARTIRTSPAHVRRFLQPINPDKVSLHTRVTSQKATDLWMHGLCEIGILDPKSEPTLLCLFINNAADCREL